MAEVVPPTPGQVLSTPIAGVPLLEKLDIFPALLSTRKLSAPRSYFWLTTSQTVCTVVYEAITAPFRGDAGAPTVRQHIAYAALRKVLLSNYDA